MFAFAIVQVDKSGGDEAIDPCAGVCVEVDDEVVGRTCRWCDEDNYGNKPMQEELVEGK